MCIREVVGILVGSLEPTTTVCVFKCARFFSQLLTEEAEAAVQPQLYGDYILENDGDGKKYGENCSYSTYF